MHLVLNVIYEKFNEIFLKNFLLIFNSKNWLRFWVFFYTNCSFFVKNNPKAHQLNQLIKKMTVMVTMSIDANRIQMKMDAFSDIHDNLI